LVLTSKKYLSDPCGMTKYDIHKMKCIKYSFQCITRSDVGGQNDEIYEIVLGKYSAKMLLDMNHLEINLWYK
jgi:hypothetical protein